MKIVYCIASFASKGGTEKVMTTKANYLAAHGHEVTVVISDQHSKPYAYSLDTRVKCIDLSISRILSGKIKGLSFFLNVSKLKKVYQEVFDQITPDVIIVLERGYEDFVIPKTAMNIPKVREYHFSKRASIDLEKVLPFGSKLKSRIIRKLYESRYNKYDAFVILTQKDSASWKNMNNVTIIPNVMENVSSDPTIDLLTRPKKAIAVGSMVGDRKGFSSLITIWSKIADDYPDWTLDIYGDGPFRINYENQIMALGVQEKIILHGVSNSISEKYLESQLFLMTSKGEGFGLVIVEAQQFGLPVVVYDCYSGPSDVIIDDFGGYLIGMNKADDFEKKIEIAPGKQ